MFRAMTSGVILSLILLVGPVVAQQDKKPLAEGLAEARKARQQAQTEEAEARKEWGSLGMADAATREIAVSTRKDVDRAVQAKAEAEKLLAEKTATAKSAAEKSGAEADPAKNKALLETAAKTEEARKAAEQLVAQKAATLTAMEKADAKEQGLHKKAAVEFLASDRKLAGKILTTRAATRNVLVLELEAAKKAAEKGDAAVAALDKALAELTAAEKAAGTEGKPEAKPEAQSAFQSAKQALAASKKRATDKVAAAERALNEADLVAMLERQGWNTIERDRAAAQSRVKTAEAKAARDKAAAEKDTNKKKEFEQTAAAAEAEKTEFDKTVAKLNASIQEDGNKTYSALMALRGGGLEPLPAAQWDYAKARHLLARAGFGGTPQEVERLHKMGLYKAVDYLVEYAFLPAPNLPFDGLPPERPEPIAAFAGKARIPGAAARVQGRRLAEGSQFGPLRLWWLERMVESPRQLQEKLALFWHGHFATQNSVVAHAYNMYRQNQLLRQHAAGNFGGLLYGMVHDPAMLRYLDNNKNVKGQPNENLAREILELFSMGADQGYTEEDIIQAARALTGYTYDHFNGQFRFVHAQHDTGEKTIFGKKGPWTGDDLVKLILDQPTTSRFVASRLFEFFAHRDPNQETVEAMATVLRTNEFELEPMLKNLFLSKEFYSDSAMGSQIKSPVQLVVGMLRDLGVKDVTNSGTLDGAIRQMGQELFEPPDVKGWRYGRSWISSNRMFIRYNAVADLIKSVPQPGGRRGIDVVALVQSGGCKTADEAVDYLAKACLAKPLSSEKRKELIDYLGQLPPQSEWAKQQAEINERMQSALILMLSMPEYQVT